MKNKLLLLSILIYLFSVNYISSQNLYINEFVSSNSNTLADEDGDYEDWVEIYNAETFSINLNGFGLSDDSSNAYKWVFPDTTIQPGEFMLVWASGKDRKNIGQPLHTSWSISSSGEDLLLTDSLGNQVDFVAAIELQANISYGRVPDGGNNWNYFLDVSPGSSNSSSNGFSEILSPVEFSHQGGFYTNDFQLVLSHPDPTVTILYTLDGSEPDTANIGGKTYQYQSQYIFASNDVLTPLSTRAFETNIYNQAIQIYNRTIDPNTISLIATGFRDAPYFPAYRPTQSVFKGTAVRAKAFKSNAVSSETKSETYFVHPQGRNKYENMPVISINVDEDKLFDYYDGIYVPGDDYETFKLANPNVTPWGSTTANYRRRGIEWELQGNLEIFGDSDNVSFLNQQVGLRLHGGWSRYYPRKSFRVYARGTYGKSELEGPFFDDVGFESYKRLVLRAGGNNEMHMNFRDAAMQLMVKGLNVEYLNYKAAVHFINGEFWGFINIRERYDHHYIKRVFDLEENEIDFLSLNQEVKHGDNLHFAQTFSFVINNNLSDTNHYNFIKTRIDIENFTDYQISNIFFRNTDWPHNNIDYFRKRTLNYDPNAPYGHDGRWRWLLFDTDHGFGRIRQPNNNPHLHNTLEYALRPNEWSTDLLRNLLDNNEFKNHFILRYADLLNTVFLPQNTIGIIDSLKAKYDPFVQEHINRWRNRPSSISAWNSEINRSRTFGNLRPNIQRTHLRDEFQLGQNFYLEVNVSDQNHGYVKVNTIDLKSSTPGVKSPVYPWHGIYFKNLPIELTAFAKPGYVFSHWVGLNDSTHFISQAFSADTVMVTAVFVPNGSILADSLAIHYWHFNDLPNDTLETVFADSSRVGQAFLQYPGNGGGYMDDVNDGSNLNLHFNQNEGRGLRVRNPSDERALVFNVPSTGYENLYFRYATKRTNNGAQKQVVQYKTSSTSPWIMIGDTIEVETDYLLEVVDLSNINEVNDNADLKIRILFKGENNDTTSGNNRFDNVSLVGVPTNCNKTLAYYFHFNNLINGNLSTVDSDFSLLAQNASITYPGFGSGYMDRVNDGSFINLQQNESEGFGLRVRNPSDTRSLILTIPTVGILNPKLSYAVKRTNFGATQQQISYRKDSNANWITLPDLIDVGPDYTLQTIDFSGINIANNNPNFQVKIDFTGQNADASSGNNRFDNLAVFGNIVDVDTISDILCQGGVYNFYNQFITSSGFYNHVFQDSSGCDSLLLILDLDIQSIDTVIDVETCDSSYFFNGEVITQNGFYTDTLQSSLGCDSTIYLNITFNQTITNISDTVCGSYIFAGNTLNSSGIYTDTLQNFSGCDSIIVLDLTIFDNQTTVYDTVCESTVFAGELLTQSGTYFDTLYNINNCNEVFLTYHLEVLNASDTTIYETACDTFIYNGNTLTQSGTYYYNFTNQESCDSLVTLVLDVDLDVNVTLQISGNILSSADTSFENYQWLDCENNLEPISGETFPIFEVTQNGIYALSVQQNGCWSTSSCIAINDVSTQEVFDNENIQLYPNPNSGQFSLKFDGLKASSQINIEIYNALGQLVYTEHTNASGSLLKEINLSKKAQGVYFVQINVNENRYHRKVVISE